MPDWKQSSLFWQLHYMGITPSCQCLETNSIWRLPGNKLHLANLHLVCAKSQTSSGDCMGANSILGICASPSDECLIANSDWRIYLEINSVLLLLLLLSNKLFKKLSQKLLAVRKHETNKRWHEQQFTEW